MRLAFMPPVIGALALAGGAVAAPVDAVLSEQLRRLKRYAETGKTG